jgi:hypothetical protein
MSGTIHPVNAASNCLPLRNTYLVHIDGFTPSFSAVMRAAVNLPSGSLLTINNYGGVPRKDGDVCS